MNGKIKTKFAALFAVALMITVCVVPMVGNDYGEAETVVVPETSGSFTVEGTILDTGGYATNKVVEVILTNTANNNVLKTTTFNGKYSFTVNADAALTFTVNVNTTSNKITVNGAEVTNPVYGMTVGPLTFTGVTGDINNANMQIGTYSISGALYYKDGSTIATKEGATVSLVKKAESGGTDAPVGTATVNAKGEFTIVVPATTVLDTGYSAFRLESTVDGQTFVSTTFTSISNNTGMKVIAEKLNIGKITIDETVRALNKVDITVKIATGSSVESINKVGNTLGTSEFTLSVDVKDGGLYEYVLLEGKSATIADLELYDSSNLGSTSESTQKVSVTGGKYILNVIYGNVTCFGKQVGATPTIKDSSDPAVSATVTGNGITGYYASKVGLTGNLKYTIGSAQLNVSEVPQIPGPQKQDVSMTMNNHKLITGKILGVDPVDVHVTVSPMDGVLATSGASVNGEYWFIGTKGNTYNVTPSYSGSPGLDATTKQIYVEPNSGEQKLNFTAGVKDWTISVNGPEGKLSGVKVYYSIDYNSSKKEGTFRTVTTDSEGNAEFTLNSDVIANNIYVYFEDDVFTFGAHDVESANVYSNSVTALEKSFKVVLKNENGSAVINDSEASFLKVSAGKYKVFTAGTVSTYDLVESYDVEYLGGGVYEFITTSNVNVYLKIDVIGGSYNYNKMTSITADALTVSMQAINATAGTWTATVTDNASVALAGINVEIFNGDELVGKYVSLNNGSITVVGEVPSAGSTYTAKLVDPAGVYTFTDITIDQDEQKLQAAEKTWTLNVKDAAGKPIVNADITVQAIDSEGKSRNSAKVEADGTVNIIASSDSKLKLNDASGKYTFNEYNVNVSPADLKANEATYTVSVVDTDSNAIAGAAVEIVLGNDADGYKTVVKDVVTDKDGKVEAFLSLPTAGKEYMAKVTSYGMGLSIEEESFGASYDLALVGGNLRVVTIATAIGEPIKEAGYVITVLDNVTGNEVGSITTDSEGVAEFYGPVNATTFAVQSPEGSPYTFETELKTLSGTGTVNVTIEAEQTLYSGIVQSNNDVKLEGVTVSLMNSDKEIVGTGVTDVNGKYEIVAIGATGALASNVELAFGKFTFTKTEKSPTGLDSFETIEAKENLYSGYYADGAVVKDVEVSYMDDGVKSLAKVIDNKYYIVTKTNLPSTTEVTATAPNFNAKGTLTAANAPLTVGDVPTYDAYFMPSMGAQILGPYNDVVYGTVLTLVAQNEYSIGVPEEDGVIQKYKFAGWYVNGDKVSDELIYAYTVEGDCTIYADYKVSSYVAAPADESNGLSMDVLVLGIVIVVLGLLAFAYAVKFKKE